MRVSSKIYRFLSRLLKENEIQSYLICPPTGNEDGLIGYWTFNDPAGISINDISGNGNDKIIYGATYSEDVPEQNWVMETV